jgi:hypothetical protein
MDSKFQTKTQTFLIIFRYGFSATSSVTISESLKFILSCSFFYRELVARGRTSSANVVENGSKECFLPSIYLAHKYDYVGFCAAYMRELPAEVTFGFAHLALFYVLINNTVSISLNRTKLTFEIFLLFQIADPGTIQLIKSSNTLMTAGASVLFLKTVISPKQWITLVLLVCGIIVTQYNPRSGSMYSLPTYVLLLFQTFLSAASSIYNQHLCKSSDGSLHAMNMTLYSYGTVSNLILHILVRVKTPEEPSFFAGYRHPGAVLVILSNVFIGLAMTAVYKYADALFKCFATAISTAVLLYLSPLLFNIDMTVLVIPGTLVIFLATWLYMETTPLKPTSGKQPEKTEPLQSDYESNFCRRFAEALYPTGPFRVFGLALTTLFTFILVGLVTLLKSHWQQNGTISSSTTPRPEPLESPLKNTLAFIRSNHDIPDRVTTLVEGYRPYFKTIHISMPAHEQNETYVDLTRDYYGDGMTPYLPVQRLLSWLDERGKLNEYDGLLYWHFDAWIEPLAFHDMDKTRIWLTTNGDGLKYKCMGPQPWRDPDWVWWGNGGWENTLEANRVAYNMLRDVFGHGFDMDPDEYCMK